MLLTALLLIVLISVGYELINPTYFINLKRNGVFFAKFTPGAIVSEVRGTIAATTFARNKGGAVIRNRIVPINRRSPGQTARRQSLASLASAFRGLLQANIAAWNAAAANFPIQDNLGQTILMSGQQLYVRFNANLILIGASQITSPPSPTSFDSLAFTSLTATADDSAVSLAFTPTVPTGFAMVVYATRPLSAGKTFVPESDFRFLTAIAAAQTSPQDLGTVYAAVFGAITNNTGDKIFVKFYLVEVASGIAGQAVRGSGVIAAT